MEYTVEVSAVNQSHGLWNKSFGERNICYTAYFCRLMYTIAQPEDRDFNL